TTLLTNLYFSEPILDIGQMQNMITIRDGGIEDIATIQGIAEKTWWPAYSSILSADQIEYMLDAIFGTTPLHEVNQSGSQQFILLFENEHPRGFASYSPRPDNPSVYKLHKLYVLPEDQGKGYGRKLIDTIISRLQSKGMHILDLNVNRYNKAKDFYEKAGFRILHEEDIPIGPYWMNDYVMRIEF